MSDSSAARRPCCGFWFVVTVALPVINTALVPVVAGYLGADLGVADVSLALAAILAGELYALRAWLRRLGVSSAGWITAAAGLIVAESAAILFVFLVIALSAVGD